MEEAAAIERARNHFSAGSLRILPWIGKNYAAQPSKILLLYEASYESKNSTLTASNEHTQFIVFAAEQAEGKEHTLFKKSFEALRRGGLELPQSNLEAIQSVSYCNLSQFIQELSAKRKPPSPERVAASLPLLKRIFDALTPDIVVVFGIGRLRSHMLKFFEHIGASHSAFPRSVGSTFFMVTQHPSGRFSYDEASGHVRDALARRAGLKPS